MLSQTIDNQAYILYFFLIPPYFFNIQVKWVFIPVD